MLKKMIVRKITVVSSLLIIMLMLYLIPSNKEDINLNTSVEYVYPNNLEVIYLLDDYNNLTRTMISVSNETTLSKTNDLIEELIINNKKKDKIPNGFSSIIPEDTKIIDLKLNNQTLIINFSKEFLNVKEEDEEKVIEALVYTLTSIKGIDKIEIYVENEKLEELPNSKKKLPKYLDKSYGINKEYEITTLNDIDSYTIYYVLNYNDDIYYTPVTKYINNDNQDKVKVIIEELATSFIKETNLMSYLDSNIELLNYEVLDNKIKLNFNDLILSDITNNVILEEVMYTIGLSLNDEFGVEEVIFLVNNEEISTFSLK